VKNILLKSLIILLFLLNTAFAAAPLPSWNDTPQKIAIIQFVKQVTLKGSPNFVPPAERIATFDNDGTLWSEQPEYVEDTFVYDRIRTLAAHHPEWKQKQPYKALLENDKKTLDSLGFNGWGELVLASQSGYTTDEQSRIVKQWLATAKHPKTGRLYTEMVYQPMLELLSYLRENGFKTYMVTGSNQEFVRPWAEQAYGFPPEQVIGSSFKKRFELREGKPVIMQLPEFSTVTDGDGKPVGIEQVIGRRPIASFGNSDGDLPMLQWTTGGSGLRLALLVHHTDAVREWAYDRKSEVGKLDKALDAAKLHGWIVVDMKNDWKVIHPFEK
jgi:phosphoglycolate phosphatase-like HAD superfamily hydrolase